MKLNHDHAIDCAECESDRTGRRATLKAIALGSAALIVGAAGTTSANAQTMPSGCVQEGWRWCHKCQGMFYGHASGGLGVCPAGGAHDPTGSGHYYQRVGTDITDVQQGGWSWCAKCQGFFYSRASPGAGGMGTCPAGGAHIKTGSGAYAAVIGETATGQQGGWRWCNKCMGMYYGAATSPSVCPKDHAPHTDNSSGHYACLD